LAVSLQSMTLSAVVAGANILHQTLSSLQTEEKFSAMYAQAQQATEQMNLDKPAPDIKRNPPLRYEHTANAEESHVFTTHQDKVRKLYFEALDILDSAAETRFSHPRLETLLTAGST